MSPKQRWFESDKDYQKRVAQEAYEQIIEDATGSAPSQGIFESKSDYEERISLEAREIMAGSKSPASRNENFGSPTKYSSGYSSYNPGASSRDTSQLRAIYDSLLIPLIFTIPLGFSYLALWFNNWILGTKPDSLLEVVFYAIAGVTTLIIAIPAIIVNLIIHAIIRAIFG